MRKATRRNRVEKRVQTPARSLLIVLPTVFSSRVLAGARSCTLLSSCCQVTRNKSQKAGHYDGSHHFFLSVLTEYSVNLSFFYILNGPVVFFVLNLGFIHGDVQKTEFWLSLMRTKSSHFDTVKWFNSCCNYSHLSRSKAKFCILQRKMQPRLNSVKTSLSSLYSWYWIFSWMYTKCRTQFLLIFYQLEQ